MKKSKLESADIACQYLHFAQTEDIQLKSALEGKMDALLITGSNSHSRITHLKWNHTPNCRL